MKLFGLFRNIKLHSYYIYVYHHICIKIFEITKTFHFSLDSRTENVDKILLRNPNATFNFEPNATLLKLTSKSLVLSNIFKIWLQNLSLNYKLTGLHYLGH